MNIDIGEIWNYITYPILAVIIVVVIIITFVFGGKLSQIKEINNLVETRARIVEGLNENYEVWERDAIAFNYELERAQRSAKPDSKVLLIQSIDLKDFRR